MTYIQEVTREKLAQASIIHSVVKEDIVVHFASSEGRFSGCCYVEFKNTNRSCILLFSPSPFEFGNIYFK